MPKFSEAADSLVQELNECRANPSAYAVKVQQYAEAFVGLVRYREDDVPVQSLEGATAALECVHWLQSQSATTPLTPSKGLTSAAQMHCRTVGIEGAVSHCCEGESSLQSRLGRFGEWRGRVAELMDFGSISAKEVVCSLLVDDGLKSRDHRLAIMGREFRLVGVGFGPHEGLKSVCTVLLASKFTERAAEAVTAPGGLLMGTWEARNWLPGAVKLSCEITSETDGDRILKRIAKHWVMEDGTKRRTDEVIYDPEES